MNINSKKLEMKQAIIVFIFGFIFSGMNVTWAQKAKSILLENATVHVGNGQVFEQGLVGIKDNKIVIVRNALAYTYKKEEWDTIIDLSGQHLYPGFISPNTTLGLTEIEAVRASNDFNEVGIFNPHVRALIAYNCESDILSTVRTNGVLLTQTTPRGGIISGASSVMQTACWNWEDGVVREDDGIHLNWPASLQGGGWWSESSPKKRNEKYAEEKQSIYSFFEQAKTFNSEKAGTVDIRFAAMKACFNGTKRLYIHADEVQQLLDVLDFVAHFEIQFPVIVGGYDSYMITEKLKEKKIPVMLPRLHSLPEMDGDAVDLVYQLPYLLQAGGVKFCLQNEGDMEAMNARNIPFLAGTAKAYGLSEEEAVRCITLSAAEILGVEKSVGSIEEGKVATLFVSKGNALDMRTNQASVIMIDGEFLPTNNFQSDLYYKYKKKYGLTE